MEEEDDPFEKLYLIRKLTFIGLVVLLVAVVLASASWAALHVYDVRFVVVNVDDSAVTCCPALSESETGALLVAFGTAQGLILATQEDGSWSFSSVMESGQDDDEFSVRAVALAVDNAGGVHIASVSYWPEIEPYGISRLIYSERTTSGWENAIVDEDVSGLSVSLAVDSNSKAHISYAVNSDWHYVRNLTYATDSTGEWTTCDLSSQNRYLMWSWGVASSICVNGMDQPYIACLTDYLATCISNLSGTPTVAPIGWGNPGAANNVYPSRPSIWVDSDDVIHVLCVNEGQDFYDCPITRTIVHYSDQGNEETYENTTISSDTDFSWDATQVVIDPDGVLRIFYRAPYGIGLLTMTDDGKVSEDPVHFSTDTETKSQWKSGISVVLRRDGSTVVSKPYGSFGYLTDSFSVSERLSAATVPIQKELIALAVVNIVIAVSVVLSRRSLIKESKWRRALEE